MTDGHEKLRAAMDRYDRTSRLYGDCDNVVEACRQHLAEAQQTCKWTRAAAGRYRRGCCGENVEMNESDVVCGCCGRRIEVVE